MTAPRQWLDRSEDEWVRAFILDGMDEPTARGCAAELMDGVERARAAGARIFWDLGTVLPMACADVEFGRQILEIFEPSLKMKNEEDEALSADDRVAAAEYREELAQQLAKIRAVVSRSGEPPEPGG
jgi:hypothetical protein